VAETKTAVQAVPDRGGLRPPGLILGVARFYHDPRGSMRGVLDSQPSEGRLFAYALIAAAIVLIGRITDILAAEPPGDARLDMISGQVVSMLFFVPLIYYVLAAAGTGIARLFGGIGTWKTGRAAFFWAALVSAPVLLLTALGANAVPADLQPLVVLLTQLGQVVFAWALAQCFAEAFGFTRTWAVFAAIAGAAFAIILTVWALS
jgi:hypothetical protein